LAQRSLGHGGVLSPFGIVFQKLDIDSVQAARGPNVKRAFADLFDSCDPGERQKEAEVVREAFIGTGDGLADREVLGLEVYPVSCQDEPGLRLDRSRTCLQRSKSFRGRTDSRWMLFV
jgi:hypothetical protein